jgi:hypothetical protein
MFRVKFLGGTMHSVSWKVNRMTRDALHNLATCLHYRRTFSKELEQNRDKDGYFRFSHTAYSLSYVSSSSFLL